MAKCTANFSEEHISTIKRLLPVNTDIHAQLDAGDEGAAFTILDIGKELLDTGAAMMRKFTFSDDD